MRTRLILAAVVALLAALLWVAPTGADPKSKVDIDATVSGTSETTQLPAGPGQLLFDQHDVLAVQGTYKNKPLNGTLEYQVRVLIPGPDVPADFPGGAVTQSATFTSDRGTLSSESSPYAVPVIGFECLGTGLTDCVDHNAVILAFGSGEGVFASAGTPNGAGPDVWTMRVERHGSGTTVTTGTLTGGLGVTFRYCMTGESATVLNPDPSTSGTFRTTQRLTLSTGVCYSELGDVIPPTSALIPGGPLSFEYSYNWDFVGLNTSQPIYPPLGAVVENDAGSMTGMVSGFYVIGPASVRTLALGSQWGENTGLFAQFPYAKFNVFTIPDQVILVGTTTFTGDAYGVLATY